MNKIYILLLCTIFFSYNTYSSPNLKVYKFKISGKVKYMKNADANGAYGCNVQIFMKKANNTLAQPTGISLNPKDLTYVLDADGNFNFDLQFESNLQLYNKILLVVLPYGPHGNVHHYDPNYKYLINLKRD